MGLQTTEGPQEKSQVTGIQKYFDVHLPVFWPSVILTMAMITVTLVMGEEAEMMFTVVQNAISNNVGWIFIIAVGTFLIFSIVIALSRLGKVRLGGRDAKPEFSTSAWFAMLFSAGMGIGIMFWSVAEPITHFLNPPMDVGGAAEAAQQAMSMTYLHWGFHAWGIYAVVGLSLAFFAFNRGFPLSFRSIFYPVLGNRIEGWIGDVIDTLAVLATLFGLATSLGLGAKQMSAGLNHLFNFPDTVWLQVGLIAGITLIATISVILGIDKGVRVLSEANIRIAIAFLIFMIVVGPTIYIVDSFVQNLGDYLGQVVQYSFWTEAYAGTNWQNDWTVFYWAWWISWSPYVGMFIARISKGRTVREFVLGVLIVPSLVTFLWLSAFGGSAISLEMKNIGNIGAIALENEAMSLFILLEQYPLAFYTSFIAMILVMSFFVTSSDSGSLVIDSLTSGGKLDAPVGQRVFWAQIEGAVAAILLLGGGLNALRTASVIAGLPFLFILLLMCYSLYKGLSEEHQKKVSRRQKKERNSYKDLISDLLENNKDKQSSE